MWSDCLSPLPSRHYKLVNGRAISTLPTFIHFPIPPVFFILCGFLQGDGVCYPTQGVIDEERELKKKPGERISKTVTKHRIICKMLKIEFNLEFCNLPNRSEKKINTFSYIPRLRDFTTPSSSLKCRREDAWVHTFSRDPLRSCDGAGAVWSQGDPDLGFSFLPRARHCASLPSQTPSQPCRGLCRGWGKKKIPDKRQK